MGAIIADRPPMQVKIPCIGCRARADCPIDDRPDALRSGIGDPVKTAFATASAAAR